MQELEAMVDELKQELHDVRQGVLAICGNKMLKWCRCLQLLNASLAYAHKGERSSSALLCL
jgi:hypothetical protein